MRAALKRRIEALVTARQRRISEGDIAEICFESFLPILEHRELFFRLENLAERQHTTVPALVQTAVLDLLAAQEHDALMAAERAPKSRRKT